MHFILQKRDGMILISLKLPEWHPILFRLTSINDFTVIYDSFSILTNAHVKD